jgi:hypothetical protein
LLDFASTHELLPWDFIFRNLIEAIPPGVAYLQGTDMLPRTIDATEFVLYTDHFVETTIYINESPVYSFTPTSTLSRLRFNLLEPPATNQFMVVNNIDPPVYLNVASTHPTTHLSSFAQEIYAFSGYTYEKYYAAMNSPWATFFVEYQYPQKWLQLLPDIFEMRILAVKMIANTIFGESTLDGGVKDMVSALTTNTPAIIETNNPYVYQQDLWQPVHSVDDRSGWEAHVWFPNICYNRYLAFTTLIGNLSKYGMKRINEEAVTFNYVGTDRYEQHFFDNTAAGCGLLGLIDYLGCMDSITACCGVDLATWPTICMFANPMDKKVELPGIGGNYFDSGKTFDGEFGPFDNTYDIDWLTDYWLGASTVKHYDFGSCLDTYNVACSAPQNTDCCQDGPDTKIFHTVVSEDEVISATTPHHPIFGGGDPGLLQNPYFSLITGA